jgi:hypothetical protein
MHALGECDCYFKPHDSLTLLEKEREWFAVLNTYCHDRWQRSWPQESLEGQAVVVMLGDRARLISIL